MGEKKFKNWIQIAILTILIIFILSGCGTTSNLQATNDNQISENVSSNENNMTMNDAQTTDEQTSEAVNPSVTDFADERYSLTIASDLHVLAPDFMGDNSVFDAFVASGDGKLIQYAPEIIGAMLEKVNTDLLILSGDLTTHGEKASHQWLADQLKALEAKTGTRVFVIPGNHDIDNPYARDFSSGKQVVAESVTPDEFASIYGTFGYDEAWSRDPNSLSYVIQLDKDYYLLMLDTCKYEDNQSLGYPVKSGDIRPETLKWLDEVAQEIKVEAPEGATVISSSHHNLVSHSPVHDKGFVIDHAERGLEVVDKLGIKLNFSGHIHIQDIVLVELSYEGSEVGLSQDSTEDSNQDSIGDLKENSNYDSVFTEVVSGSLIQYPQTYGVAKVSSDRVIYQTQWVDMANYLLAHKLDSDEKLAFLNGFQSNAELKFRADSVALIDASLLKTHSKEEVDVMLSVFADLNEAYFAGTDSDEERKEAIRNGKGYALWTQEKEGFLSGYVESMLLDTSDDNFYEGDLR